jgi:hypothetical protein
MVADVDTNPAKGKIGQKTFDGLDLVYGWPVTEMTTTPSGGFHMIYEGWDNDDHPAHIMALGENGIGKDIDSPNYTLIPGCTFDDGTSYVSNGLDAVRCPEWINVRRSWLVSLGSIAVNRIGEPQAVHCGPWFCVSSMRSSSQFGVLSSPTSQPAALDLKGSDAMTFI